jgi:hypothetical protein
MVTLVSGKDKIKVTPIKAQGLLYIQKGMGLRGWELPNDSPYEFKDNALIKRTDKKVSKRKAKPKGDSGGRKAPGTTEVSHRDDPTEG